jgi:hypothetical protein
MSARVKLEHACDQWYASRVPTASYRFHRKLRPNAEGGAPGHERRADVEGRVCCCVVTLTLTLTLTLNLNLPLILTLILTLTIRTSMLLRRSCGKWGWLIRGMLAVHACAASRSPHVPPIAP